MRNLKVKNKLILSFSIVLFFSIVISLTGTFGMRTLNIAGKNLYQRNVVGTNKSYDMYLHLVQQRTEYRNIILSLEPEYEGTVEEAIAVLRASEKEMKTLMDDYAAWVEMESVIEIFNKFINCYNTDYTNIKETLITYVQDGQKSEAMHTLFELLPAYEELIGYLKNIVDLSTESAADTSQHNVDTYYSLVILQSALVTLVGFLMIYLAIRLAYMISRPLRILTEYMLKAGSTGNMQPRPEDEENIRVCANYKDELGQIVSASAAFVKHILSVGRELETIAGGDLTSEFELLSPEDSMGLSLQKMTVSLNSMFSEVNNASLQVSTGCKQVADGSQSLSASSVEQAAAMEQLSSSVSEVATKTTQSAGMARDAANLSQAIKGSAEKGSAQMDNMMSAVKEINDASQSIEKVIKVIDDIAFQTNILALNAAVEAARAGQHGKGFAVVAEEVRNLAAKSAEAAKDTGSLIANSMDKAQLGAKIASETAASLGDIVEGINKSSEIVAEISSLSDEQAAAISQINEGINNVSSMVQLTSATSEESAAASEEMNSQASLLLDLVNRFKVKDSVGDRPAIAPPAGREPTAAYSPKSGNYGKY